MSLTNNIKSGNDNKSTENQWVSVRRNKKNSYKSKDKKRSFKKKNFNTNKIKPNKIHFIPFGLKLIVDKLFERGLTAFNFFEEINREVKENSNIRTNVVIYIINEAASLDKLDIIEYILNNVKNRSAIVNTKSGYMEYTPIFKSAYRGSIKALKMLCCGGADLKSKNKLNETVMEALEQGRIDALKNDPEYEVFINERYDECKQFLSNFSFKRKKIVFKKKSKKNKKIIFDLESKVNIENMTINELIEDYYDDIVKITEYVENKFYDDILIDIICKVLEKDINTITKFFNLLPVLGLSGHYDLLINSLKSTTVNEYINFDCPLARNIVNDIIKELN